MGRPPNTKTCLVEGCGEPVRSRGLCRPHYTALMKHGDPLTRLHNPPTGQCSVAGCDKPDKKGGMCNAHYQAWRKHGDPLINNKAKPRTKCAAEGCEVMTTREYCDAHRHRVERYGSPFVQPPLGRRPFFGPCSVFGCGRVATSSGFCPAHRNEAKRPEIRAYPL